MIIAGEHIIHPDEIVEMDLSMLAAEHRISITTNSGQYVSTGFHAVEAVLMIKPSALEGRNLRWVRGSWAFHNIAGHLGLQILVWLGFTKLGLRWHDYTCPSMKHFIGFR